jgi:hypothetical protein
MLLRNAAASSCALKSAFGKTVGVPYKKNSKLISIKN